MTIVFLIKKGNHNKPKVCLAEKKRGYRAGKFNGSGGKFENGENAKQCAIRETYEELGVKIESIKSAGEVVYEGHDKIHDCFIFTSTNWEGNPTETEEMKPYWYDANNIPFEKMGETDPLWLQDILKGKVVNALFKFNGEDKLIYKQVTFK